MPPWVHAPRPSIVTILRATFASSSRSWLTNSIVFGHATSSSSSHSLPGHVEEVVGLVEEEHVGIGAEQQLEGEPLLLTARQGRTAARRPRPSNPHPSAAVEHTSQSTSASYPPASAHVSVGARKAHPGRVAGVGHRGGLCGGELDRGRPHRRGRQAHHQLPHGPIVVADELGQEERPAVDRDRSRHGLQLPHEQTEQRGLAGAVGADERDVVTPPDAERHIIEQDPSAREGVSNPVHLQRTHGTSS